ncbi:hypothetical protein AVDCRST_MAG94-165 [uncultured Leptolyngbya sp.]|uniref:Uncharacterized protein n=1 Tax=uncultured Leptolyngbya sp. TaxID=332963 RepID=A0A6J4K8Q2_9CYAN|nr:hypothetical protein AVDCRST_MAG94-165 [uncultured Leptolyngbya sp.]
MNRDLSQLFGHSELVRSLAGLHLLVRVIMSLLKDRLHRLVEQLADDELLEVWAGLAEFYCDCYMLRATQASKETLKPGDTLTREEALRFLSLL